MLSPQDRALARLAVEKRIVPREAMEAALRDAEPPDPRDPWSILRARGLLKDADLATLRALTPFASGRATSNATLPAPGPRSASGRPTPRPATAPALPPPRSLAPVAAPLFAGPRSLPLHRAGVARNMDLT